MDKALASIEIMELFLRAVNKCNSLDRIPARHGSTYDLYHSESHMLDRVGDNTDLNVTELARDAGVTKGAISQVIKKLETKGLVRKYKKGTSDKEVFVELTEAGRWVHAERVKLNIETLKPLKEELSRHSSEEIVLLISIFNWLDKFLDQSGIDMKAHSRAG